MPVTNKDYYDNKRIQKEYNADRWLLSHEIRILSKYEERLASMRMLDIGVGAGRTTYYFGDLAREYVAVDYSEGMIDLCKKKFPRHDFRVCDARDMGMFADHSFDFVLFSANGLDMLSHEDRLTCLREVKRLCKAGGTFVFSAHNVNFIDTLFKVQTSKEPFRLAYNAVFSGLQRMRNPAPEELKKHDYVVIRDGRPSFDLQTYYIKPKAQIRQLEDAGFRNVVVYSLFNGLEIKDPDRIEKVKDWWLYYSCEA